MSYIPHTKGRPPRGDEPTSSRTIRFTFDELSALEGYSREWGFSRAELVREACASVGLFDEVDTADPPPMIRRLVRQREREERERIALAIARIA